MNKFRYPDRDTLCKYNFSHNIFEVFNVEVLDIIPLRKVFIIDTTEGKMILKRIDNERKVEFITKSLQYISKNYSNIMRYHKSKNNNFIEKVDGESYILLEMNEGREVSFTNEYEIELCTKEIANIHKASLGIGEVLLEKKGSKEFIDELKIEGEELDYIEKLIKKFRLKNNFDNLVLESIDYYKNQHKISINMIDSICIENIWADKKSEVLCHNDLAHHNFIINGDGITIIDYDYCYIGTKILDVYNFINKVMKNINYDSGIFYGIINKYRNILSVSGGELNLLNALMYYPKDYCSMLKSYYFKQKSWDQDIYFNRLKHKIDIEIFRKDFLENRSNYS